jgi:iron complex transport system ATP-binding protein
LSRLLAFALVPLALASLFWDPAMLRSVAARDPALAQTILIELRLPRTALALIIGASLGLGGAAMQALLRNPLASPDVLGPSTGAALGAVVAGYFLGLGTLAVAGGGILGALLALGLLLALAGRGATTTTLVLAGVAISALGGALVSLALSLAPSPYALYDLMFWLWGSLADRSLPQLVIAGPLILGAGAIVLAQRHRLDSLALGEEVAPWRCRAAAALDDRCGDGRDGRRRGGGGGEHRLCRADRAASGAAAGRQPAGGGVAAVGAGRGGAAAGRRSGGAGAGEWPGIEAGRADGVDRGAVFSVAGDQPAGLGAVSLVATAIARPPMLAPLSLALAAGTLVGLVGPNGAGKTTLLRALAGIGAGPGRVTVAEADLASLSAAARARRLAWLPADRDIAWPMAAADLVQLGLGPGAPGDAAAVAAALAAADAGAFAGRRVDSLSTGERARVLLARALVARPDWLMLDEPVANLDPWHRLEIMAVLRREAARGAGVVVALHDLDLAQRCDRVLMIDKGALVADGAPAEVLSPQNLAAVFRIAATAQGWSQAG